MGIASTPVASSRYLSAPYASCPSCSFHTCIRSFPPTHGRRLDSSAWQLRLIRVGLRTSSPPPLICSRPLASAQSLVLEARQVRRGGGHFYWVFFPFFLFSPLSFFP